MSVLYTLSRATRPAQQQPDPVAEFSDLKEAIEAAREIIRVSELNKTGPNYAEVRWRGRLCYCTWVKPANIISVVNLLDEHPPENQ